MKAGRNVAGISRVGDVAPASAACALGLSIQLSVAAISFYTLVATASS